MLDQIANNRMCETSAEICEYSIQQQELFLLGMACAFMSTVSGMYLCRKQQKSACCTLAHFLMGKEGQEPVKPGEDADKQRERAPMKGEGCLAGGTMCTSNTIHLPHTLQVITICHAQLGDALRLKGMGI